MIFQNMKIIYKIDMYYKFREINSYSDSLQVLIEKQLWFFKRPYEAFLILASISVIILASNLNLYVDNDNGTYVINNKLVFVMVTLGTFLFIYGSLKVASIKGLKALKAYLHDLQQGALEKSEKLERTKKRYLWLWIIVFVLLAVFLIIGLLYAFQA